MRLLLYILESISQRTNASVLFNGWTTVDIDAARCCVHVLVRLKSNTEWMSYTEGK